MQKNHLMNLLNIWSFNPTPKNSNSGFTVQLRNITVTPSDSGGIKVTLWKTRYTKISPQEVSSWQEALCPNSQSEQVLCKGFPEVFAYRLTPCLTFATPGLGSSLNKLHSLLLQFLPQTTDQRWQRSRHSSLPWVKGSKATIGMAAGPLRGPAQMGTA